MTVIIANLTVGRPIFSNQILKLPSFPKLGHLILICSHFSSSLANSVKVNRQDQCKFLHKNELFWPWHQVTKTSVAKIKFKKLEEKCHINIEKLQFSLDARVHTASYRTSKANSALNLGAHCICVVCIHIYRALSGQGADLTVGQVLTDRSPS